MEEISNAFYTTAAKIEADSERRALSANVNTTVTGLPMGNSTFVEKQRQLKLPVAELPKFNGDVEHWLSFKNTFKVMIDSRSDINNLVKFMYLKSCLEGEAANKINVCEASEENYATAWTLLVKAYERKRVLISKHLDAIFDIPKVVRTASKDLAELVDAARQHVNMLKSIEFSIPDYIVVRALEKALPGDVRLKWEETLDLDEIPDLQRLYDFIGGVVFRLRTMERDDAKIQPARGNKRSCEREPQSAKVKKGESGSRALVTTTSGCYQCQANHFLYRCPDFEKLSVQARWDAIKAKKVCRNCLRKHAGECPSKNRCKHCSRFHHTLLHSGESKPNNAAAKTEKGSETSGSSR